MEEGSRVGGDDDTGDGSSRRQMELDEEEDEEEAKCKAAIEVEKRVYKGSFQVRTRTLEREHNRHRIRPDELEAYVFLAARRFCFGTEVFPATCSNYSSPHHELLVVLTYAAARLRTDTALRGCRPFFGPVYPRFRRTQELRELKAEIEHIQRLLEKGR